MIRLKSGPKIKLWPPGTRRHALYRDEAGGFARRANLLLTVWTYVAASLRAKLAHCGPIVSGVCGTFHLRHRDVHSRRVLLPAGAPHSDTCTRFAKPNICRFCRVRRKVSDGSCSSQAGLYLAIEDHSIRGEAPLRVHADTWPGKHAASRARNKTRQCASWYVVGPGQGLPLH